MVRKARTDYIEAYLCAVHARVDVGVADRAKKCQLCHLYQTGRTYTTKKRPKVSRSGFLRSFFHVAYSLLSSVLFAEVVARTTYVMGIEATSVTSVYDS